MIHLTVQSLESSQTIKGKKNYIHSNCFNKLIQTSSKINSIFFKFTFTVLFTYFWLPRLSLVAVQTSHCSSFSCCGAQAQ